MPQLHLRDITKTYDSGEAASPALRGIDLVIQSGTLTALVGPSGCGKSTLLAVMGLLLRPDTGSVLLDGVDVAISGLRRDSRLRAAMFSYVVQDFALIEAETVAENVQLPLVYGRRRIGRHRRRTAVHEALAVVGLSGFEARRVKALSGGERQRVAIARALASNADVVLADEPTGNLDTQNSASIFAALRALVDRGKTVVMATHNPELAVACDRVVELKDGLVVLQGGENDISRS